MVLLVVFDEAVLRWNDVVDDGCCDDLPRLSALLPVNRPSVSLLSVSSPREADGAANNGSASRVAPEGGTRL